MSSIIPDSDDGGVDFGVLQGGDNYLEIPDAESEVKAKAAEEDRIAKLEQSNRELAERTRSFEQNYRPPVQQTQQYVPPAQAPVDHGVIEKQLGDAFFQNPGATMKNIMLAAQQNANAEARKQFIPLAAQNARMSIQMFKSAAQMDSEVEREFDSLISGFTDEQLASADPAQMSSHLTSLRRMAVGAAAEKGWAPKGSRPAIPQFGGSSTVAPAPGRKRIQLNERQREALQIIKDSPAYLRMFPTPEKQYEAIKDIV